MHCDIYKFSKTLDLYVYIARPDYPDDMSENAPLKDWLGVLPKDFRQTLGRETFMMHLDLNEVKKLARVDKSEVLEKLKLQGYFVQMPPPRLTTSSSTAKFSRGTTEQVAVKCFYKKRLLC